MNMKRILLPFAILALASCVKEAPVTPVQPGEGQVCIKAVAAESKTLLDGFDVVWEKTDEISVVLEGLKTSAANFAVVESSLNRSNADFAGTLDVEWDEVESAYAVYPATAVDLTKNAITHKLPENQVAGVTSGMILSSAVLSVDDLQEGKAEAVFNNALSLLNVVVPAGVKSVELTSTNEGLVGTSTFNIVDGILKRTSVQTGRTVSLVAETELAAKTYPVLVYPANVGELKLKMVGTDETVFEKSISGIVFNAGKARKVDLTQIFHMSDAKTLYASPLGGTLEIPVVTTADYDFTVTENASWISVPAQVKAFHGANVYLNVEQNNTGAVRTAEITVSWEGNSRKFTVSQESLFLDFVQDAAGKPIFWQESFGIYATEDNAVKGESALKEHTNEFRIEFSDDFSKGMYKVHNLFLTDKYYDVNGQPVQNKGGEYYADYESGKLIVKRKGAVSSYNFAGDVALTYNQSEKTFTIDAPIAFTANSSSSYNKDGFIGGYKAVVAKSQGDSGSDFSALYGVYDETCSWPAGETLVVEKSDNSSYDLSMKFFYTKGESSYSYDSAYGKVSADKTTVTVTISGGNSNFYGPVSDFVLNIKDNEISGKYVGNVDYKAIKR
jgi:hypothetical protein